MMHEHLGYRQLGHRYVLYRQQDRFVALHLDWSKEDGATWAPSEYKGWVAVHHLHVPAESSIYDVQRDLNRWISGRYSGLIVGGPPVVFQIYSLEHQ